MLRVAGLHPAHDLVVDLVGGLWQPDDVVHVTRPLGRAHAHHVRLRLRVPAPAALARELLAYVVPHVLGVDEHPVEVEDDGLDHLGGARHDRARSPVYSASRLLTVSSVIADGEPGNNMSFNRTVGVKAALVAVLVLLVLGVGTGAAVCRFADVACHINPNGGAALPEGVAGFAGQGGGEMELVDGLTATTVASGLRYPTDLAFLPDGRILAAEKDGLVRVIENGNVARKPFLDLRARVNTRFFRGIVDLTVDVEFPRQPFVYVAYTVQGPRGRASPEPITAHVSRFRVRGEIAVLASEKVLLGSEKPPRGSCRRLPRGADCLPAEVDHVGADLVFTPRGTIFISTGDGGGREAVEQPAFAAQDLDTLGGKILHVDRDGRGVPGNPYWNGDPDANRSKIWAVGLRNPFRMSSVPGEVGTLVVGDVGWDSFEELDVVRRGSDQGWPCFEGPEPTPRYEDTGFCRRYYEERDPTEPWYSASHAKRHSITAGVPMDGASGWPSELAGQYVFGDWTTSEIYAVPLELDAPAQTPRTIATHAAGPVAFALRPEGLYFVAVNTGELRLIAPK